MSTIKTIVACACAFAASLSLPAANWDNWRGPDYNGSSPETGLPAQWTKADATWSVAMPGDSAATPIVWEDRIFVSSLDDRTKDLLALCLDRKSGKVLWQTRAGSGFGGDDRSNKASPSPLTNGKLAIFYYGSGDLLAFDMEGNQKWARNIQNDFGTYAFLWTYSSSPLLHDGKLYIPVMQRDYIPRGRQGKDLPSYLLALDPDTGKTLWQHLRPSEAREESREAFTTPIPVKFEGREEIVLMGGDDITGHDPATGKELWRWGTWNPSRITHWRVVPSAVFGNGVILACAPKGGSIYAIKAGGSGQLPDSAIAWESQDRQISADVCTPAFYKDHFYIANTDRKSLSCVEAKTGKVKWTGELGRQRIEASPTVADGKVYVMNFDAEVFVVDADPSEFKLVSKIEMGDGDNRARSSIAVAQGQLFIRTQTKLHAISKSDRVSLLNR